MARQKKLQKHSKHHSTKHMKEMKIDMKKRCFVCNSTQKSAKNKSESTWQKKQTRLTQETGLDK